jgi:undecaprenyl pyrophosphate phosphatase UppP
VAWLADVAMPGRSRSGITISASAGAGVARVIPTRGISLLLQQP